MTITGTAFNYYQLCQRKLWLFANDINMEHTSDLVCEGKLIHEKNYPHRTLRYKEIAIDGIKVDYYDANNRVIHEIKKSNKIESAHEWQLKYYMYIFELHGVKGIRGILEYPLLRKTKEVELNDTDRNKIQEIVKDIERIVSLEECPPLVHKGICHNCSYYDFCYASEPGENTDFEYEYE